MSLAITDPSFVNEYVENKKWSPGYNCYTLLIDVYKSQWGIDIPPITVDPDNLRQVLKAFKNIENDFPGLWKDTLLPEHGDAILFGLHKEIAHVGIWLEYDGGLVLHCARKIGVTCSDLFNLRLNGFSNPVYKRYVG